VEQVEFRILGPVGAWRADGRLDLGRAETAKARCVLAVLLRTPGELVTTAALTERVWGDAAPGPAVRYKYIGWLRTALAPHGVGVVRREAGYLLQTSPARVDVCQFRELAARGQRELRAGRPADASRLLGEALGQWRGTALTGLTGQWAELFRDQLGNERRDAAAARLRAGLALGQHAEMLAELADWVTEYPADEQLAELSMLALYRSGYPGQALDSYRHARDRIRAAMDAEPGPRLRELHQQVLARDPGLLAAPPADQAAITAGPTTAPAGPTAQPEPPAPGPVAVPRQLPTGPRYFAGRLAELTALRQLLDDARPDGTVPISVISGTAGVGKSTLAVHFAHEVSSRFPDGQLYVNLRGFDPSGRPVASAEAIRGCLDALGIAADRIPADPAAQAGLYRSLMAGQRILVLLDNARDAEQVRPLLPAAPGCLVVVTSRIALTGLAAADGACPLTLDLLSPPEAAGLLAVRLGAARTSAEPAAAAELISLAAGLPLALSIIAARAAAHPALPLTTLTAELRGTRNRLDALETGDRATDLRAVFSWSYRQLPDQAARMFRLLGLHPGPDISSAAAASLAGLPGADAHRTLDGLTRAHLLTEHRPGRFALPDILREYAAEQAAAEDSEPDRRAALHRVLDHYLRTASAASALLDPAAVQPPLPPPEPAACPEDLTGHKQALAWFRAEHRVLLAVLDQAAADGSDAFCSQLPPILVAFFHRQGHRDDWAATQATALAAARRLGDHALQASAHRQLGHTCLERDRPDQASEHYQRALELYEQAGEVTGQAHTLLGMARAQEWQHRFGAALEHAERALALFRTTDLRAGEATALNAAGWVLALAGQDERAVTYCRQALALHQQLGNTFDEASTWDSLGLAEQHLGNLDEAIECYHHALALYQDLDDRRYLPTALSHLGDAEHARGNPAAASAAWRQALAQLDALGHPDASPLRAKLGAVSPRP
jgi:tetratricopeptide (TPR) repeat protein/DNA-binding SARP family transcriptional activator